MEEERRSSLEKTTPTKQKGKGNPVGRSPMVKSPSDTTIYAPVLARNLQNSGNPVLNSPIIAARQPGSIETTGGNSISPDQISQFIQGIRIQAATPGPSGEDRRNVVDENIGGENPHVAEARLKADHLVLQVEQYKAAINAPPGEVNVMENIEVGPNRVIFDDDFFHISCHMDQNLRSKIERGEFVDLKKLLP